VSRVELRKYYDEVIGKYIKHQLRWLKYLTLTVFYEGCYFNYISIETLNQDEIDFVNGMEPEELFEYLNNDKSKFLVNMVRKQ